MSKRGRNHCVQNKVVVVVALLHVMVTLDELVPTSVKTHTNQSTRRTEIKQKAGKKHKLTTHVTITIASRV